MCVCAYSSLLRLKVFNFYVLVPNHQTDELSLLWFAAYLCRLMAPLCHNYLNLASDQKSTSDTVFYTMGKADLVPFLGSSFVSWFPVVILIPATLQLLNIQNRLLRLCGMGTDDNETLATGEDTETLGRGRIALNTDVEEGKLLVDDGESVHD
ncbi:hypothetical protein BC937DRAFT_95500 [Endogone sp. FLAS-F59071]|nr:hypothetical protein BC937DRAFT_95500 [Endogone sp. FLAS-F59071]|eukprot:RUS20311.1 hypothetical protein BC937DRAFT_95500 [Endogone sp. FLAS-F59071]